MYNMNGTGPGAPVLVHDLVGIYSVLYVWYKTLGAVRCTIIIYSAYPGGAGHYRVQYGTGPGRV